jgi:hypothetical protein
MDLQSAAWAFGNGDVLRLVIRGGLYAHPNVSRVFPRNLPAELPEGEGDGLVIWAAGEVFDGVDHGV